MHNVGWLWVVVDGVIGWAVVVVVVVDGVLGW